MLCSKNKYVSFERRLGKMMRKRARSCRRNSRLTPTHIALALDILSPASGAIVLSFSRTALAFSRVIPPHGLSMPRRALAAFLLTGGGREKDS